jgi:hypothetical protein
MEQESLQFALRSVRVSHSTYVYFNFSILIVFVPSVCTSLHLVSPGSTCSCLCSSQRHASLTISSTLFPASIIFTLLYLSIEFVGHDVQYLDVYSGSSAQDYCGLCIAEARPVEGRDIDKTYIIHTINHMIMDVGFLEPTATSTANACVGQRKACRSPPRGQFPVFFPSRSSFAVPFEFFCPARYTPMQLPAQDNVRKPYPLM